MFDKIESKYTIQFTSDFKQGVKRAIKRGQDINKLIEIIGIIASGDKLDDKYKDHKLINNKRYNNCRECHIEPDWLLVYKIFEDKLILLLYDTGKHNELFEK